LFQVHCEFNEIVYFFMNYLSIFSQYSCFFNVKSYIVVTWSVHLPMHVSSTWGPDQNFSELLNALKDISDTRGCVENKARMENSKVKVTSLIRCTKFCFKPNTEISFCDTSSHYYF